MGEKTIDASSVEPNLGCDDDGLLILMDMLSYKYKKEGRLDYGNRIKET